MNNNRHESSERPRGFACCPHCHELIDASSEVCHYCHTPVRPEDLAMAAELQRRLSEAKSHANDRSAFRFALRLLVITVVISLLYFLARMGSF